MGQLCIGGTRPRTPEEERKQNDRIAAKNGSVHAPLGGGYGREDVRLNDLLGALRTGLVFNATEFSVLPGISTTGVTVFSIGSSQLIEEQEDEIEEDDIEEEEEEEELSQESPPEERSKKEFQLRVSLHGGAWTSGVTMQLSVAPAVGPFAGRKVVFKWRDNTLRVHGCCQGELNAKVLPQSFDSEMEFCKCCLLLVYHHENQNSISFHEEDETHYEESHGDGVVYPLSALAYKVAVSNLDAVPETTVIPAKVNHLMFGIQNPVVITIRMWPASQASKFAASRRMKVKSGILFSEFLYLLRQHFGMSKDHSLKLYHNYKQIQPDEQITSKMEAIDCFVTRYDTDSMSIEEEENSCVELVVSLVGYGIQNVEVDLEMPLKDFDVLLRKKFRLKDESFLIIVAEDDYSPQYTTCDSWKCIFSFSLPDNSFGAGLRRSFQRLSSRRQREALNRRSLRSGDTLRQQAGYTEKMAKVIKLLSSQTRNFPRNNGRSDYSIAELHSSMQMYNRTLDQCGIHPYAIVQVFEVTGPSIPVTFRTQSDHTFQSETPSNPLQLARPSRLANIMDINPEWSLQTFLQYVDALISPSSGTRKKRVIHKDNLIEDSKDDLSAVKLGELLDQWEPVWWSREDPLTGSRLTSKLSIEPTEFLVVEKH